jgi:TPR repeat protein
VKQRVTSFFAGGVLALTLFGVAVAGQFEDGQAAYQHQDYANAMRLLRPLAEQGNADAQFEVGQMYGENVNGVQRDYAEALKFYNLAARQGHAHAMRQLSWMYSNGYGVKEDVREGWKWLQLSAEKGDTDAQLYVGRAYSLGGFVPQDYAEAG